MPKLTDTQLIVLSKAAQRDDGAASVPERVNSAAAKKIAERLISHKLMREIRTKPDMPVWRLDESGRSISLVILRAGREAIGVPEEREDAQTEAKPNVSTRDAMKAEAPLPPLPRPGSKQALIISLLSKGSGATISSLIEATGWLPHTTRAALTGLRKRGFKVERSSDGAQGSLYRITGRTAA